MKNNVLNKNITEEDICLICWENITDEHLVQCFICNILMHNSCEEKYRSDKKYCKCPHCQEIGTLGCYKKKELMRQQL